MKAVSKKEAWKIVDVIFPTDYEEDGKSSKNAGYPIYRSTDKNIDAWISDRGRYLEVNLPKEKTININIEEDLIIYESELIRYLQSEMDNFMEEKRKFGAEDRIVLKKLDALIANKEMVETFIRKPVNLGKDGQVTVGF